MSPLSAGHIFISYSRRDEAVTQRMVDFLRKHGMKVWVDNEKLVPGTPIWEEEIEKAIKGASAVVVVLSPDSKGSEWVRREISLADQHRKRIFPILVRGDEDSSVTLRLITRQYVDLRENEVKGLTSLHGALSEYLNELNKQVEEKARESAEIVGREKAQKEAMGDPAIEKTVGKDLETEHRPAPRVANQLALWLTIGWAVGGFISGFIYSSDFGEIAGGTIGGAIGGVIGGLVTSITLRIGNVLSRQKNIVWITLAWAIGGGIGWLIGWELTEAIGAGIGTAIFATIGLVSTMGKDYMLSHLKSTVGITLAWAVGGAIGWIISRELIYTVSVDNATGWAVGMGIGWAIGGFVMGWQLKKDQL